jgi:hypothetical protein
MPDMKAMWTVTVDNDMSGTVIFEVPAEKIADEVAKVIQRMVSGVGGTEVSMIAIIMRVE